MHSQFADRGGGAWPEASAPMRQRSISRPNPRATATGSSPSTARSRRSPWTSTRRRGLLGGYELKLNSYDLGVDIELADAIAAAALRASRGDGRRRCIRQGPRVLRRRQHPHAGGRDARPQGQLLQVHQRDAQRASRTRARIPARSTSASSTAPRRAAATSSRSPATTSCWSTTARRRCRCPRCRCSRCCRAPAGSRASPTSARCAATVPTCSAPPRKA